jgi:hypothetical protein
MNSSVGIGAVDVCHSEPHASLLSAECADSHTGVGWGLVRSWMAIWDSWTIWIR